MICWTRAPRDRAIERLSSFAKERGHTSAELAIAWLLTHREVSSVIVGATRPEQVVANAAAGAWVLGPEDRRALDELLTSA